MAETNQLRPNKLKVSKDRNLLTVVFDDGGQVAIPAELLRVRSPSAEVRGHGSSTPKLVTGKQAVKIAGIEPVGNYAVRIKFDDGHDTGLYRWDYLVELGDDVEARLAAYAEEVARAARSRSS